MSKPLTIDEIKALEVFDWVWVVGKYSDGMEYRRYMQIDAPYKNGVYLDCCYYLENDYGKTWIAYKNKEQAEKQTKYKVGDTVYFVHIKGYGKTIEECAKLTIFEFTIRRIYCGKTKTTYYVKGIKMGIDETLLIGTKEEAQQRLKELQGESK